MVVARFGLAAVAVVAVDRFVFLLVADLDGRIRKRNLNWKRENPTRSVGKPGKKFLSKLSYCFFQMLLTML